MDTLTFVAELVKALSWPLVAVALVLILRRPLSGLIPSLQRLKYKEFELQFGQKVAEIEEEVRSELPASVRHEALPAAGEDPGVELARVSPRAAVLDAWREVEQAALAAAERNKLQVASRGVPTPGRVLRALREADLLEPRVSAILEDLRGLRNQAAHAPEFAVTGDAAVHYARLARSTAEYLRQLGTKHP